MLSSRRLSTALFAALTLLLAVPTFASAAGPLEAEPTSVSFGEVGIHDSAQTQDVKITNVGVAGLVFGGFNAPPQFAIEGGASDCDDEGLYLLPAASCNLRVVFSPTALGSAGGNVTVAYSDLELPFELEIPVSGTGTAGTLEGNSPSFYPQPYFYGGQQQQMALSNVSPFTVIGGSTAITGPDAGAFEVNYNGCNGQFLQSSFNCILNIAFNPSHAGTFEAQLEVFNDGPNSPAVVPLSAEALAGPAALIEPGSVDFGIAEVNSGELTEQLTITNAGDAPLQIQQLLVLSGTPQSFPLSNDGCTMRVLVPEEGCEITVGFIPTKAGERAGSIFLISNTPGPVTVVPLTAEAMSAPNGTAALTNVAKVGVPIVCLTHGYRDADTVAYQWLADGNPISGADQSVYVPIAADTGAALSCEVNAENAVGEQSVTSAPSAAVAAADVGPEGPQGPQGPQGEPGENGDPGSPGQPGSQGPQGPAGGSGPQGPAGQTGAQGETGAPGATGATGTQGETGATGATGETGVQGPAGQDDAQGPAGQNGVQGPTGQKGANGTRRKKGAKDSRGKGRKRGHHGRRGHRTRG